MANCTPGLFTSPQYRLADVDDDSREGGTTMSRTQDPITRGGTRAGKHKEEEDNPWGIYIPDHADRKDSAMFVKARAWVNKIVRQVKSFYFGSPPYQAHHGGSLWLKDTKGWFLVKNMVGMEWSSQFCADPEKVDELRQNAARLYARFPEAVKALDEAGLKATQLLSTPIRDPASVAAWTDSVFNACVPLRAPEHTGTLPQGGGCHHYPTPITDIQFFKHDDFTLWVVDPETKTEVAVLPIAPRGSGDGRVQLAWAPVGHPLQKKADRAAMKGKLLVLPADHMLAERAFAQVRATGGVTGARDQSARSKW
jgi:hypothetical protein